MRRDLAVLEAASALADLAEVLVVSTEGIQAVATPGGGVSTGSSRERVTSLRLARGGRTGIGSAAGGFGIHELVDAAVESARIGPPQPPSLPGPSVFGEVEMCHPQVEGLCIEDLAGAVLGLRDELLSRWPSSSVRGEAARRRITISLCNSSGFDGSYTKSVLDVSFSFCFAGRDGFVTRHAGFRTGLPMSEPSRLLSDLMPCPGDRMGHARVGGRVRAVLSPQVAGTLLQTLRMQAAGWTLQTGPSTLSPGDRIASDAVTVLDRPRLPYGGASAPFDAEGVPTADRCLVDRGIFTGHIHDLASAAWCGCSSTGSAGGNPGALPVPVCTNLVMLPGEGSLHDLLSDLGDGVYIAELLPGGTGDARSGRFTIPVAAAFSVEGGEVAAPLGSTLLEGNSSEILSAVERAGGGMAGVETDRLPHLLAGGLTLVPS